MNRTTIEIPMRRKCIAIEQHLLLNWSMRAMHSRRQRGLIRYHTNAIISLCVGRSIEINFSGFLRRRTSKPTVCYSVDGTLNPLPYRNMCAALQRAPLSTANSIMTNMCQCANTCECNIFAST